MKSLLLALLGIAFTSGQFSCTSDGASAVAGAKSGQQPVKRSRPAVHYTEYTMESDKELKERLSPLQYHVTRENGTERPFSNEYWNNKQEGIYVDIISGEPLFSSTTKFESSTGWPSFYEPIDPGNVVEVSDRSHGMTRTEVRSKRADSHLGHVFPDGPPPTGQRYCINSAALRFIPKEKLSEEGYEQYLSLFEVESNNDGN